MGHTGAGGAPPTGVGPGRRVLHICYCCADAAPVTEFFVAGLGLHNTMNTPREPSDGSLLGIDGTIISAARFVYDQRGPRVGPAIEIQEWAAPEVVGRPSTDPFEAGIKAHGFAVSDLVGAAQRLASMGASVVFDGRNPHGERCIAVIDPTGVLLELVEDAATGPARIHHLRITVTDLDRSLAFYHALGCVDVANGPLHAADFAGIAAEPVAGRWASLAMPDEPFQLRLYQWIDPPSFGRHYAVANHAGLYRVALAVDDTRSSFAAMAAAGIHFDRAPRCVELHGTPVPDLWIAFLSDPDGVPYELVERPRHAFADGGGVPLRPARR